MHSSQEQYIPMTRISSISQEVLPDYTPPSSPVEASAPFYSSPYSVINVTADSPSVMTSSRFTHSHPLQSPSTSQESQDNIAERDMLITPTAISAIRPQIVQPRPVPFSLSPHNISSSLPSPRTYKKKLRSYKTS